MIDALTPGAALPSMSFEISLRKPSVRLHESNRIWMELVSRHFAHLHEEVVDHAGLAAELACDIGLSAEEFLARGIGLVLEDTIEPWMQVSFWDQVACIELPNFPEGGARRALDKALPIVGLLRSHGFELEDPSSGDVLRGAALPPLLSAYASRQRQVETVAKVTGGTPR